VSIGLLSLGCAFIAFKAAFVRHDYIHVQTATGFLLLLGWQCVAIDPPRRAAWWLGVFALAWVLSSRQPLQALAYPVRTVANNVQGIWIRSTYSNLLEDKYAERIRELRAARPLPKLAGRTDIFPVDHADIIANDLEWGPRPVFQSYSAYTPALAAKNAAYLSGPNSPDNIFFGIAAIDGRFPALDDGPSWPILLTRYAAVQEVGDYVLLRKRETSLASEYGELLLDRQAAVGERVVIPATGAILLAEVEWQPSLLGKLAATAFKLPTPRIAVELADGAVRDYRFVPSVSDAGFVLSPLVETPEAFVGLAGSGVAPPVTGVRFHCDQSALCFLWESSLTVRVRELTIAR
jgi:hypothetical protein